MLENDTLVTPFGKEDTAAELQSHAARTQDTLVNAVENAEVTEIIRAVFRALTRLRAAETKEFDTIARPETQITNENNETFRRETVSHEFRTPCLLPHKQTSRSTLFLSALIPLSLIVGRFNTGAPVGDGWKPTHKRTHCFSECSSVAFQASTDLKILDVVTMVRRLAAQEHSVALAQLASRISANMKFGVGADDDPAASLRSGGPDSVSITRTDFVHEPHNAC